MGFLLACIARLTVALIQSIPLDLAARIGRSLGSAAWHLDRRHRRVALENLQLALGSELSRSALESIAKEHFKRLGENYCAAIKTASMTNEQLAGRIEIMGFDALIPPEGQVAVIALGHFGNFEVFARLRPYARGRQLATTYRALKPDTLDRALQQLRSQSGILFFERTRDGGKLRSSLNQGNLLLGLLSDQHAGRKGLWIPFFGQPCSTGAAPAVYAQRFHAPLAVGICFRTKLGHWRLEFSDPIPTRSPDGSPRTHTDIMREVNAHFEAAVRRDPANWFWVHRRWKKPSAYQLSQEPWTEPADPESE
jgi:KDO2-lipid IV(A) lauroyltransferase